MQILHPKWIVPVVPRGALLEDHSVVIKNNKISEILPQDQAKNLTGDNIEHVDLSEHILMPGLINCHTHVPMNLFRGYADDMHLQTWLEDHIWQLEEKFLSPELCYEGALLAISEMLKGGVTCFNDMYFFTTGIAKAAVEANMRAAIGINIFDFETIFAKNADECLAYAKKQIDEFGNNDLIQTTLGPHAPYTVNDENINKTLEFAKKYKLKINMHIHESEQEITDSIKQYGMTPIQRLNELGFLNKDLIAVHVTQLNDEDLQLLKDNNVSVVHCPESNLKLANGFCDITRLLDNNINVALGTDSAASNNDLDMFSEMRLAALMAKGLTKNPTNIDAHTSLEIATINGARALGIDNKVGSVEVGKEADLIAVHFDNIESLPIYNPASQLVYATNNTQVTDVWINGKHLLKDRKFLLLDEKRLKTIANKWQTRIS